MKSYQRVLKNVSWTGVIIGGALGLWAGFNYLDRMADAREAHAFWCLDAGGRTVEIDNATGCFELTEVPIVNGMFGDIAAVIGLKDVKTGDDAFDCRVNPKQVWIVIPGMNSTRACYTFKRINREN